MNTIIHQCPKWWVTFAVSNRLDFTPHKNPFPSTDIDFGTLNVVPGHKQMAKTLFSSLLFPSSHSLVSDVVLVRFVFFSFYAFGQKVSSCWLYLFFFWLFESLLPFLWFFHHFNWNLFILFLFCWWSKSRKSKKEKEKEKKAEQKRGRYWSSKKGWRLTKDHLDHVKFTILIDVCGNIYLPIVNINWSIATR